MLIDMSTDILSPVELQIAMASDLVGLVNEAGDGDQTCNAADLLNYLAIAGLQLAPMDGDNVASLAYFALSGGATEPESITYHLSDELQPTVPPDIAEALAHINAFVHEADPGDDIVRDAAAKLAAFVRIGHEPGIDTDTVMEWMFGSSGIEAACMGDIHVLHVYFPDGIRIQLSWNGDLVGLTDLPVVVA